ncbi:MAG: hypothetical protein IKP26_00875 [Clostridia bacterium]|nr:hypothetical protein [Clostridia bacterium]MBR6109047.1 hypothetical protein [Clostridia bacterium]
MFECDSCRLTDPAGGLTTLKAGEAAADMAACGYRTAYEKLPRAYFADQSYSAGLCPGIAPEKGTMFPELVSEY